MPTTIRSLDELLDALRAQDTDRLPVSHGEIAMDELPTFGGDEPASTVGVWSWDETRLLVGDGVDDLRIVPRTEA